MPDNDAITLITYLVGFFSPIIVEALKRDTWKPEQTVLLGAVVSTVIYVAIHGLLGALTFPVTIEFIAGLVAVFGLQQAGYQVYYKDRSRVVEVPVPAAPSAGTTVITGNVETVEREG